MSISMRNFVFAKCKERSLLVFIEYREFWNYQAGESEANKQILGGRNVVVGRIESFREMAHTLCILFSLSVWSGASLCSCSARTPPPSPHTFYCSLHCLCQLCSLKVFPVSCISWGHTEFLHSALQPQYSWQNSWNLALTVFLNMHITSSLFTFIPKVWSIYLYSIWTTKAVFACVITYCVREKFQK